MRLSIIALSVALCLGAVGVLSADEEPTSSWFARIFAAKAAPDEAANAPKKASTPPPASPPVRLRQAEADWHRRQEVCLALRELADKLNDDELRRKVEWLDQRVWDAYVAASGLSRTSNRPRVNPDAKLPPLTREARMKESP